MLQAEYGYDAHGRVIWTKRADGRYTTYTRFDAAGRVLWTVQNPTDGSGNPVIPTSLPTFSPTRPDANIVTRYGYDGFSRVSLITQTGILTGTFNPTTTQFSAATVRVTKVEYDALSRPVTRTLNYVPTQPVNTIPDVNVQTYTYYDGAGNVIWQSDASGNWTRTQYDGLSRPVTVTANYENGFPLTVTLTNTTWTDGTDTDLQTVTIYDDTGRVARTITNYVDGVFTPTEPQTDVIRLPSYDGLGRVITQMTNAAPGQSGTDLNLTSVTRYDALTGRVVATQDALGQWAVPQYDVIGRTTHTILNCRDAQGNPAWTQCVTPTNRTDRSVPTSIQGGYDGLGRATLVTDTLGVVSRTEFDGLGRVITTTQNYVPGAPTSAITNVHYVTTYHDSLGQRVSQIDPVGATTTRASDALGRTVVLTDSAGLVTRTGYDGTGAVRWTQGPDGTFTVQQVDGLGRVVTTIANYQNGTHGGVDGVDQDVISQTIYDGAGRRWATIAPDGRRTELTYDQRGLLIGVEENVLGFCASGRTDCNLITRYEYDRAGNRTAIIDANDHIRRFAYDTAGRQITATDALSVTTAWTYTVTGQVTRTHDPRGDSYDVLHTYDELGRISATVALSPTLLSPITWTYDTAGRTTSMADGSGTTTYAYDPLGRVTDVTTDGGGHVGYGYTARGERASLTYPDSSVVDYTYTANGRLETVETTSGVQAAYSYDPTSGWLTSVATGGGITTTYQYDALGRIDHVLHATPLLGQYHEQVGYNLGGQVVGVTETWNEDERAQILRSYTYDGVGRLTESVVEDVGKETTTTQTQTYDAVGNRLTQTVNGTPTQSFTYSATNQVEG